MFLRLITFAIAFSPVFAAHVHAQDTLPRPRFVVMDDYIRDSLAADWDRHAGDRVILERGYCLGYQLDLWANELSYRVTQISMPDSAFGAGPSGISFTCIGKYPGHLAELHVHPPQTCMTMTGQCWTSGPYAWQCLPSDQDQLHVDWIGQQFGMVQCSREGIVFYLADSKAVEKIRVGVAQKIVHQ